MVKKIASEMAWLLAASFAWTVMLEAATAFAMWNQDRRRG